MTRLGVLLHLYRVSHALTVNDVAADTGLSPSTVSRLERGGEMNVETLLLLLAWFRSAERAGGVPFRAAVRLEAASRPAPSSTDRS